MVRGRVARVGKQAAAVSVGLAIGLGGAFAIRNGGREGAAAPTPSVKEFSFAAPAASGVATVPADPESPPAPAEEPADGRAAVTSFLQFLADGRPDQAYPLLDQASRERFPTVAAWIVAQADRIAPLTFEVGPASGTSATGVPSGGGVEVAVTATHRPSLDPFRGLVPGGSLSQWRAAQEAAGAWRVAANPVTFRAVLPDDGAAPAVVSAWITKLAACDSAGAASYQFDAHLYGPPTFVRAPCETRGDWTVGAPAGLDRTPDPKAFLAAFGPEVGSWVRLVPVQGPGSRFLAAVAPLGDTWHVLGVAVE